MDLLMRIAGFPFPQLTSFLSCPRALTDWVATHLDITYRRRSRRMFHSPPDSVVSLQVLDST